MARAISLVHRTEEEKNTRFIKEKSNHFCHFNSDSFSSKKFSYKNTKCKSVFRTSYTHTHLTVLSGRERRRDRGRMAGRQTKIEAKRKRVPVYVFCRLTFDCYAIIRWSRCVCVCVCIIPLDVRLFFLHSFIRLFSSTFARNKNELVVVFILYCAIMPYLVKFIWQLPSNIVTWVF